jgi:hypothetical protein
MRKEPKARGPTKQEAEKPQKQRFIEAARKVEADESGETFERALSKILPSSSDLPGTKRRS